MEPSTGHRPTEAPATQHRESTSPPHPPTGAGPEPAIPQVNDRVRHRARGVVGTVHATLPNTTIVHDDFGSRHFYAPEEWELLPDGWTPDVDPDLVAVYARAFGFLEHAVAAFLKDWQRYASNPTRLTNAVNTLRFDLSDARGITQGR